MLDNADWIKSPVNKDGFCPEFYININCSKKVKKAILSVSAIGMYIAYLNNTRVGNELFTPRWTEYKCRTQFQKYDVTELISEKTELSIVCAEGWAVGYMGFEGLNHSFSDHISTIYSLNIEYVDGTNQEFVSNDKTKVRSSKIVYSQIYNGETVDNTASIEEFGFAVSDKVNTKLVESEGEIIAEQEHIMPVKLIVTPKGEHVIDFGQNLSGYVQISLKGRKGERIKISHAEVLDKDGNFYVENLRSAKQINTYVLSGIGNEVLKPTFTWQGFRYIRLDEFPKQDIDLSCFMAIAVYSDIKRTGHFSCGNEKINQLYHNIIWGQKGNYIDVPTDCPQRDERLGWTGDAQVFTRTAAINFDVEKFFVKWLNDLKCTQGENGEVYGIVPTIKMKKGTRVSAAWGDAAVICPWEIYLAYGNKSILESQFYSMQNWVEYIHHAGDEEFLWLNGYHYGDWLTMDEEPTNPDYIASAFFAYSTSILIKAGYQLGKDMKKYENLYQNIVATFKNNFTKNGIPVIKTQTACVLALHFNLCQNRKATGNLLVKLIEENNMRLTTGFVGTPYLLHSLSEIERNDIAYNLLLQEKVPSWLYSVNCGATTMWERWNVIQDDGSFCSGRKNSFNHYAYGCVYDWIFGVAAGIKVREDGAGYRKIEIKPVPDKRLGFINSSIETRHGLLSSSWYYKGNEVYFEFIIPNGTSAIITLPDGRVDNISGGKYIYSTIL